MGLPRNDHDRRARGEAARRRSLALQTVIRAEDLPSDDGPLLRVLKLNDLRTQGIWPHGMKRSDPAHELTGTEFVDNGQGGRESPPQNKGHPMP